MPVKPTVCSATPDERSSALPVVARKLVLQGLVQGIGMRPAVVNLADKLSVAGNVCNRCYGLEILIEGSPRHIDDFLTRLPHSLPTAADVTDIDVTSVPVQGLKDFAILTDTRSDALHTQVPCDRAMCPACLSDYLDPRNARYLYPLISCTNCGPRYSIIREMPFEREQTELAAFPMCSTCRDDYQTSENRRFHAQTVGCPACGPDIWFQRGEQLERNARVSLRKAGQALQQGEVLGLLGLGGYHLLADARRRDAVHKLRERKRRLHKPFAILVANLKEAARLAHICEQGGQLLLDSRNPVVLLPRRRDANVDSGVAGELNTLGLMLPSTPVHSELTALCNFPLVATSGNREGDPLEADPRSASEELSGIADCFLHHNRPVIRPIDDSVVRPIGSATVVIRNGRGRAPLSLPLSTNMSMLATGGQQKNALALSNGRQAILGPHVGDLDSLSVCRRFQQQREALCQLYRCVPQVLVHDLHPDYFTTQWATTQSLPTIAVQHHHAHVVSGMLEHELLDQEVLGIACDGTGYGSDGTIWGGEFLLATVSTFRRVGHLTPFRLPGGEAAIQQPWRIAAALLTAACGPETAEEICAHIFPGTPVREILQLCRSERHCPETTSLGRLFDGFASLILSRERAHFEGELPMLLEAKACTGRSSNAYPFPLVQGDSRFELDWKAATRLVVQDLLSGRPADEMASRFHRGLAAGLSAGAALLPDYPIVLAGGCFQNHLLLTLLQEELLSQGRSVVWPQQVPINDGGLAAGQLAVASARLEQTESKAN